MDNIATVLRDKYFGPKRSFHFSPPTFYDVEGLLHRLSLENSELRLENDRLRTSLRAASNNYFLTAEMKDLTRGNRLLSEENVLLTEKYQSLLLAYNKLLQGHPSTAITTPTTGASQLPLTLSPYTPTSQKASLSPEAESNQRINAIREQLTGGPSDLSREYDLNQRIISEISSKANSKYQSGQIQHGEHPWKKIAQELSEALNDILRICQNQWNLFSHSQQGSSLHGIQFSPQVSQRSFAPPPPPLGVASIATISPTATPTSDHKYSDKHVEIETATSIPTTIKKRPQTATSASKVSTARKWKDAEAPVVKRTKSPDPVSIPGSRTNLDGNNMRKSFSNLSFKYLARSSSKKPSKAIPSMEKISKSPQK